MIYDLPYMQNATDNKIVSLQLSGTMDKITLVLAIWIAIPVVLCAESKYKSLIEDGRYHTKYDNVDVGDLCSHRRLIYHYVRCMINKGPCPSETADLKHILREQLETSCALCNEKQVHIFLVGIQCMKTQHPALWKQLTNFYDPEDIYFRKFEEKYYPKTSNRDQENALGSQRSST